MDTHCNRLINLLLLSLFSWIGVGDGTIQSGYWRKEGSHHWHNTTGDVVYSTTARRSSDCASVCLESTDCLMCGYSPVTGTCHGFRYLENNPVSILDESEVIYKYTQSCLRAGYVLMADGPLCVKKHVDALTWNDAQIQCEQDHGRLVVIDDAQKFDAFVKYLESVISPGPVWVGINDKVSEGSWVWLNGASLNTNYWTFVVLNDYSSTYAANIFSADCARTYDGKLIDDNCLLTSPYVCERADLV